MDSIGDRLSYYHHQGTPVLPGRALQVLVRRGQQPWTDCRSNGDRRNSVPIFVWGGILRRMKLPEQQSMNRRQIILASTMAALAPAAPRPPSRCREPGDDVVELWPGGAPGGERVTVREEIVERLPDGPMRDRFVQHVTRPLDHAVRAQGCLQRHHAAHRAGRRLCARGHRQGRRARRRSGSRERGFAAAVLRYRLPADGWADGADAPVHDAMRAAAPAARARRVARTAALAARRRHRLFGRRTSRARG